MGVRAMVMMMMMMERVVMGVMMEPGRFFDGWRGVVEVGLDENSDVEEERSAAANEEGEDFENVEG
jgi:hypothetical protein